MMAGLRACVAGVMLLVGGVMVAHASQGSGGDVCKPAGSLMTLSALPEASGLAIGKGSGARLWMHNDSGAPELIAVDASGKVTGRVVLNGARVDDWEALASGPCGKNSCLYVGDIGDNDASRKQITIYRVPEPAQASGTVKAETFHAAYPDSAHDAETLLVSPAGMVFVVTKGESGPIAVYKFPQQLQTGTTMKLERVGGAIAESPKAGDRVTDGAFSADGRWVVLRTRSTLTFYRGEDFTRGNFKEAHRVDVSALNEPQGEAVVFGAGNTLYIGGEGGGKNQPGTLAALSCAP
jgi:hypothetical protein